MEIAWSIGSVCDETSKITRIPKWWGWWWYLPGGKFQYFAHKRSSGCQPITSQIFMNVRGMPAELARSVGSVGDATVKITRTPKRFSAIRGPILFKFAPLQQEISPSKPVCFQISKIYRELSLIGQNVRCSSKFWPFFRTFCGVGNPLIENFDFLRQKVRMVDKLHIRSNFHEPTRSDGGASSGS